MNHFKLRNAIVIGSLAGAIAMASSGCSPSEDATGASATGSTASGTMDSAASDASILSRVEANLAGEGALSNSSSDVDVSIANGVVTLTGEVADAAAKTAAERAARAVDGVRSVRNDLTLSSRRTTSSSDSYGPNELGDAMSDSWITTQVKAELLSDDLSSGFDVEVETVDGWVTLTGTLVDRAAIDHVRTIVEGVDGVRGVDISSLNVMASS
ncbi:MAG: BON domain-containing protein [Gammaproteobacteria bacterium]|nr:BON domain-containing protein [Gammaproteobacteria bacterium]